MVVWEALKKKSRNTVGTTTEKEAVVVGTREEK